MKKILSLTGAALIAMSSCKKDNTCSNTVTVTDGNSQYSYCGNAGETVAAGQQAFASVSFHKGEQGSLLLISASSGAFSLNIQDSTSPAGIGTFAIRAADSVANTYSGSIGGWVPYKCSGGTITVNHLDAANVAGTFTLNLFDAAGSRTITGTFDANKPVIVE